MNKKLISLDPYKPPLYPLMNVLRGLAVEEFKPYSGEDLDALIVHLNDLLGTKGFAISEVLSVEETSLLHPVPVVDFLIGSMMTAEQINTSGSLLDLTGIPSYCYDLSVIRSNKIIYTVDSKMGIDVQVSFVLEKGGRHRFSSIPKSYYPILRYINRILEEYNSQKDLIIRDLRYKSALLQNFLEHPKVEIIHFNDVPFPSPVFAFSIPDIPSQIFIREIKDTGFDVGVVSGKAGKDHYLIANYINHSKEQIERFIDQMDRILV